MTLDEEIKRLNDNAEHERDHGNLKGCLDFRRLAEWLKKLQTYEEAREKIELKADKCPNPEIRYGMKSALYIQEKCLEEVNVNEYSDEKREDVTNGDVIRALFSNISIVNVFGGDIWFKVDNSYLRCSESWWNSPYKECDIE